MLWDFYGDEINLMEMVLIAYIGRGVRESERGTFIVGIYFSVTLGSCSVCAVLSCCVELGIVERILIRLD